MYRARPSNQQKGTRLLTVSMLAAVFLIAGAVLVYNRNGFMAITEIKGEINAVKAGNDLLRDEIDSLQLAVFLLENDSLYIEKRVREILGWGRPGEQILRFVESGN
jgi:cell division protein FtsB